MALRAASAAMALAFATALPAQEATVNLELDAGAVPVARLLELASRQLHCSILVNPFVLATLPPIEIERPIRAPTRDDALAKFTALLHDAGLALIPADASLQLYEVVAINGQRHRDITDLAEWKTAEAVLRQPQSQQAVTALLPLAHIDAAAAAQALRAQQPQARNLPALTFAATVGNAALLLNGLQEQVAAAIGVVQQLDRGPAQAAANSAVGQLQQRLTELDQQVVELEKQLTELQPKQPAGAGK